MTIAELLVQHKATNAAQENRLLWNDFSRVRRNLDVPNGKGEATRRLLNLVLTPLALRGQPDTPLGRLHTTYYAWQQDRPV